MSYAVVWSREASLDLDNLTSYLAAEVSDETAEYVRASLLKRTARLAVAPFIYPLAHRRRAASAGLRTLSQWDYVIHYSVLEEESIVVIVGVEHAHRNT